jgi:hypothetical protein
VRRSTRPILPARLCVLGVDGGFPWPPPFEAGLGVATRGMAASRSGNGGGRAMRATPWGGTVRAAELGAAIAAREDVCGLRVEHL